MRRSHRIFFWLSLFLGTLPAFSAGRVQCASLASHYVPGPVGCCALLPPSYDSQPAKKYPVLYFLHGLGGDQTFLVNSGAWSIMEDAQEEKRIGELVIITPQAGTSFYINSKDESANQSAKNYQLFRYMLGCNAFGKYPTKFNGGLFTFDPQLTDTALKYTPDFRNWLQTRTGR